MDGGPNRSPCGLEATHINSADHRLCAGCYQVSERALALIHEFVAEHGLPPSDLPQPDTGRGFVGVRVAETP